MVNAYKHENDPPPKLLVDLLPGAPAGTPLTESRYYLVQWSVDPALFTIPVGRGPSTFYPVNETAAIGQSTVREFVVTLDPVVWAALRGARYLHHRVGSGSTPDLATWQWSAVRTYQVNHDPVSDAGGPALITLTAAGVVTADVVLDAGASFDVDPGTQLSHSWTLETSPQPGDAAFLAALKARLQSGAPVVTALPAGTSVPRSSEGLYVVRLTVQDDDPPSIVYGTRGTSSTTTAVLLSRVSPTEVSSLWPPAKTAITVGRRVHVALGGDALTGEADLTLTTRCLAPNAIAGPRYADAFGIFAHAVIAVDYETRQGVARGLSAYIDDGFAGQIDPRYAAFLIGKNPALPSWAKVALAISTLQRPDVVLDDGVRREFEEVKPASATGLVDGLAKVATVSAYMASLALPYTPGVTYVPTPNIPIFSTTVTGVPVHFSLSVARNSPGLIVYKYCIRTDWSRLAWRAVIALILLIMAILTRGRFRPPVLWPRPIPVG